jgi:hypothetical protein
MANKTIHASKKIHVVPCGMFESTSGYPRGISRLRSTKRRPTYSEPPARLEFEVWNLGNLVAGVATRKIFEDGYALGDRSRSASLCYPFKRDQFQPA